MFTFDQNTVLRLLILDNYDSFTWNLVHYAEQFTESVEVRRNDEVTLAEVEAFDKIILSPGPGLPKDAGIMPEVIREYASTKSILGICLGLQGIAECFGAELYNLSEVLHGTATIGTVEDSDELLFKDVPSQFEIGHYHSWAVKEERWPEDLIITARNEEGLVMGLRHRHFDVRGLQFHPESVLTPDGLQMMKNWIEA